MNERPLIFSLLVALIVILVVFGVSLAVQINRQAEVYKKEVAKNISLQKDSETVKADKINIEKQFEALRGENDSLKSTIAKFSSELEVLKLEKEKVQRLKDKIEQNLADELIKQEPPAAVTDKAVVEPAKDTKVDSKEAPKEK